MSKEIIKIEKVTKSVEKLTSFDITVNELKKEVEKTKNITVDNLEDKNQIDRVKIARIELRKIEKNIEDTGLSFRGIFTKIGKDILVKERELLAITSPEVDRLKEIETKAKELKIKKEREMILPYRVGKLSEVDNKTDDEILLEMDDKQFGEYLMEKTHEKEENERLAEEEKKKEKEREKEIQEAREQAKKEAEAEAKKKASEAKLEANRKIKEAKDDADRKVKEMEDKKKQDEVDRKEAKKEKEKEAKRIKDDKIKEEKLLAKRKEFVEFREKLGYTKETKDDFRQEEINGKIILFKKVGEYLL